VARSFTALAAALVSAVLLIAPAGAIQGGTPDGNGHPYVGMAVFYSHGVPLQRCSGTLVSATVYITAGHCTGFEADIGATPDHAEVWFASGPIPRGNYPGGGASCKGYTGYPCKGDIGGTPAPHPDWSGSLTLPDTHDVGVVVLGGKGWKLAEYAKLAPRGYLDKLATQRGQQDVTFTLVGYGVQFERPNLEIAVRERFVGTTQLIDLSSALAGGYQLIMSGGVQCFGDSGGPVLLGSTVYAVNSFVVNGNCAGSGYAFRVDLPAINAWIRAQ
jgi:hypothetical protein